ncbi:hypothetical protein CCACVL1_15017 [Corchorus capsularis]|uniref:Uncharacterized protein n=1 Tax=Corchorus capsularis TaxID=210143 RepID=A0A1R3I4J2_COCAP|nr:hypothetical protein CCACVL1_15017 [Corchorus capsularis]
MDHGVFTRVAQFLSEIPNSQERQELLPINNLVFGLSDGPERKLTITADDDGVERLNFVVAKGQACHGGVSPFKLLASVPIKPATAGAPFVFLTSVPPFTHFPPYAHFPPYPPYTPYPSVPVQLATATATQEEHVPISQPPRPSSPAVPPAQPRRRHCVSGAAVQQPHRCHAAAASPQQPRRHSSRAAAVRRCE